MAAVKSMGDDLVCRRRLKAWLRSELARLMAGNKIVGGTPTINSYLFSARRRRWQQVSWW